MALIQLLIAILATYRLAHLLSEDEGPFFVFTRIRSFVRQKAVLSYCKFYSDEDGATRITFEPQYVTDEDLNDSDDLGVWANVYAMVNCPYCLGLYAAILVSLLVVWQNFYGNLFLLIFAIAGGQSFLQKMRD